MKTNKILMLGMLLLGITGCYKDKGNYDYKNLNDFQVELFPASTDEMTGSYVLRQPANDTTFFKLTASVTQTLNTDESNLAYEWIYSGNGMKDTITTKEVVFVFPPKKSTTYSCLLRVRDLTTGIDQYRSTALSTIVPYSNSWLVLHGEAGDRKIGAIEYNGEKVGEKSSDDIYMDLIQKRRFQKATAMLYSSIGHVETSIQERLFVFEPDTFFYIHPFDCRVVSLQNVKNKGTMLPSLWEPADVKCGYMEDTGGNGILVSNNGKFCHGGSHGFFYDPKVSGEIGDYRVDNAFISNGKLCVTMWDNSAKKFMYYDIFNNWYNIRSGSRQPEDSPDHRAILTAFPDNLFRENELENKELIWLGRGISADAPGASAIMRDIRTNEDTIYQISYEEDGGKYSKNDGGGTEGESVFLTKTPVKSADYDRNSLFASSSAFTDQFFYTIGNSVYLYNTVNGENIFLYSVGNTNRIIQMKFRVVNVMQGIKNDGERVLGLAVETPDGKGELHEIFLDNAADVEDIGVYPGFGPIVDFYFTSVARVLNI